ncbi:MAG: hypothetical protein QXV17_12730 [Candidatus Micrarchaeaceae archaeon]
MSGIYGISSTYTPLLLSHQTGLSVSVSTAGTFYSIGSAISIPRSGIAVISMSGHVSAGNGFIQLKLTRGNSSYLYGEYNNSSGPSLFGNIGSYNTANYISSTTSLPLFTTGNFSSSGGSTSGSAPSLILPVYSGDSLQFYATNETTNDIIYIDDVLVLLL